MIRVTTNGTLRGYKSSLTRSSNTLNASRNKVLRGPRRGDSGVPPAPLLLPHQRAAGEHDGPE